MIHVLVLLECVLLMIIGFDEFVGLSMPDRIEEPQTRRIESLGDAQHGLMRPSIVPTASAAGADVAPSTHDAALPAWPQGAGEPLQPELQSSSTFSSRAMREDDRIAIARELLGIVDDQTLYEPNVRSEAAVATDESDFDGLGVSLPRPAKAKRAKLPAHPAFVVGQPAAKPKALPKGGQNAPFFASSASIRVETPGGAPPAEKVAEAQRLLRRLGYQVGDVDGVLGKRTEQAIRSFQQRRGGRVDGRISDGLSARMTLAASREGGARSATRHHRSRLPQGTDDDGWFGSVIAKYQRLVGHDFNSVARPRELQSYCRLQSDTWVFDEGKRRFMHCGQLVSASK